MKLQDLFEAKKPPMFAWFDEKPDANGIPGFELRYIVPLELHYNNKIQHAAEEQKLPRVKTLKAELEGHRKSKNNHKKLSIDWWADKKLFDDGKEGANRTHKGQLLKTFPNMEIKGSYKEALKAAQTSGILKMKNSA